MLVVVSSIGAYFVVHRSRTLVQLQQSEKKTETAENQGTSKSDRLRIIAGGDMLPHDSINQQAKTADGYDYKPFFGEVEKYFKAADVRFCNQEAPSAGGSVRGYPAFNAPEQFARDLSSVGCNVISLANNHSNDIGQTGIDKTVRLWEEIKPLAHAGSNRTAEEQQQVKYFESKGVKFAFVAYAEYSNNRDVTSYGLNLLSENLVASQLKEAHSKADIVLVSVHWGTEYSPAANAMQEQWANTFAAHGADIVMGHGPHVLQPVKKLLKAGGGETIVWFSLGNLLSTQLDTGSLIGGLAVMDINTSSKEITEVAFLPMYMHYEWTADEMAREDLLKRRNIKLYALDASTDALARSQNNTSVEAQTKRVTDLLNQFTSVKILKSSEY